MENVSCCVNLARGTHCLAYVLLTMCADSPLGNDFARSTTPMVRANRHVAAVTHPPKVMELKYVEAVLDKWEEQGKVLKKDFGRNSPILSGLVS